MNELGDCSQQLRHKREFRTRWLVFPLAFCHLWFKRGVRCIIYLGSYILFIICKFNLSNYFIIMNSSLHCVNLLKWGSLCGGLVQGLFSWQTKLQVGFAFLFPIICCEFFLYLFNCKFLPSLNNFIPRFL